MGNIQKVFLHSKIRRKKKCEEIHGEKKQASAFCYPGIVFDFIAHGQKKNNFAGFKEMQRTRNFAGFKDMQRTRVFTSWQVAQDLSAL